MKWRNYEEEKPDLSELSKNKNTLCYCLVELEDEDKNLEYHIAAFHPNIVSVGGHFAFDRPPIKRWVYLKEILGMIE